MTKTFEVPKSPTPKTLKYVNAAMNDWYGIDLTDDQIEEFGKQNPALWADILAGNFDTVCREQMSNVIVQAVLGSGVHWPLNGEGSIVYGAFIDRFKAAAKYKGIRIRD